MKKNRIEVRDIGYIRGFVSFGKLLVITLLMVHATQTIAQDNSATVVDPVIQKKSEQELQAIQGFLASHAPILTINKVGIVSEKNISEGMPSTKELPGELEEKSKEEAVLEILIMKNQIFQGGVMPARRKQLNIESFLNNLKSVLKEDFDRLANNEELLKQLDLFIEESSENQ